MILKPKRHESRNLRRSACGQVCMVRIPRICNHNPATTILAHLNGGGAGTKHSDLHGSWCCSSCHDAVDGRISTQYTRDELKLMLLEGMVRTQQAWLDAGLVVLK